MTAEEAIATRLLATSGVTSLVSTRVWMLKLPQAPTLPAIRVQLITEQTPKHLRGPIGTKPSRIQVDCYALESSGSDPYAAASAVADAVAAAIGFAPFTAGTVRVQSVEQMDRQPIYESEELRLVRMLLDYRVWSTPAS